MTPTAPEPTIAELLTRLDRLESVQQITELHNTYVRDLADRNWSGVAEAYADDAICDIRNHGVHSGRDAIQGMFDEELLPVVHSRDGYILSSPNIVVDGDRAHGVWTWHRFQADFKTGLGVMRVWGPWSEGKYVVDYARIDGVWKISKLWFRVHAPDSDADIAAAGREQAVIGGGYGRP
ncbi:nuclear transport factor 2 family protein [Leucobacter allii]|uniref:Nuclear transport factor 2 family protein n=1 Tax=Leucobacter allii TaxID=2932247 RepID=A0ABY4FLG9_9MICO|nr:nuclear transport factor 2 family protein [Leucobacter allii]UOQ57098.1 nuclear transport factor 2 family protein [Leucobacter allii]UOR01607.1 nuclear transport factor 2 family protein [Leucobacter allii]